MLLNGEFAEWCNKLLPSLQDFITLTLSVIVEAVPFLILGIIILAAILVLGGYIVLSVMNAAMWMDDSMRWGGRDDS